MKKRTVVTSIALAGLLGATAAGATVIPSPLAVDFRSAPWTAAYNQPTWTVGAVTAVALPPGNLLYQDNLDGLGILGGYNNDELDMFEMLQVNISGGMLLDGIWITDLFGAPDAMIGERGKVIINDLWTFSFDGNFSDQANGEFFLPFGGQLNVTKALFYVDNLVPGIDRLNNDYSVAGFSGPQTPPPEIPEPASLLLLGAGLAGAGAWARRRQG